jgi:hypothetical protein
MSNGNIYLHYEGLELSRSKGEFEEAETETGYKGGWSYSSIFKRMSIFLGCLDPRIIETINEIIVQENYWIMTNWIKQTQEAERRQKPRKQYEYNEQQELKKANKMRTGYTILNTASIMIK